MRNDAIDMKVNKRLLAFFAEEEGVVGVGVHEEVFGQDSWGRGMAEDVEVGFEVGVGVGVVGAYAVEISWLVPGFDPLTSYYSIGLFR